MKNVREGYKISEKGIIPSEWLIKSFDECISIKNGQVDPKIKPYCDMIHIGPGNIEKFTGKLLYFNTAKEDMQTSGKYLFDDEDILYGKINPQLGKVVYPKFEGICSADMYPLKANESELIPLYLKYLILSQDFFNYSVSVSMRTGMPKINRNELSEYKLLLPNLKEQEKISLILYSIDEKIENTDKLIEKTNELKKGLMQRLLKKGIGHDRFKDTEIGRIPEEWEVRSLINISQGKGEYGIGAVAIEYVIEKPRYLRITDIGDDSRLLLNDIKGFDDDEYEKYLLKENDIVFARTGNTTGKSYVYSSKDGELVYAGFLIKFAINPKIADVNFIKYIIQSKRYWDWINVMSTRSGQPGINSNEYAKFLVPIPHIMEQNKIALILSSVDEKIEKFEAEKEKLQELKKGLMQKLLTGKIRVQ